jgi:hypothetical protein
MYYRGRCQTSVSFGIDGIGIMTTQVIGDMPR